MPPSPPRVEGLETAAVYRPADPALVASGDFYDLFEARDGWIAVVGDVSGNGAGAAVVTGLLRHSLRAHAVHEPSPARLLDLLNRALFEAAVDELATLVCARLQRRGDHFDVTLVSAGHPPPLVRRASGDVEPSPGLRARSSARSRSRCWTSDASQLGPGDLLLLYTDGLIEARGDRGHARRAGRRRAAERHGGARGRGTVAGVARPRDPGRRSPPQRHSALGPPGSRRRAGDQVVIRWGSVWGRRDDRLAGPAVALPPASGSRRAAAGRSKYMSTSAAS